MKDIPILFSAPMVRAILAGTKTQTRRVVKPQPERRNIEQVGSMLGFKKRHADGFWLWPNAQVKIVAECPHGQPGTMIWVRETFYAWGRWETRYSAKKGRDEWHFVDMTLESGKAYEYPATGGQPQPMGGKRHRGGVAPAWWKRPAIHMPRAASRITLEITGVRVERLKSISSDDAYAEGAAEWAAETVRDGNKYPSAVAAFQALWESINGPESWAANPWCWAVEFKHLKGQPA